MSANTVNWYATVDSQLLESEASAQRIRLHESIVALRSQMQEVLDIRQHARDYMLPAAALVAGLGLVLGYGVAGIFRPRISRDRQLV